MKFMLLDVSDEKTVFQSGLNYKVMQSIIESWDDRNKRPLVLKSYVETRSLKQDYEFLLINSWEDEHDFLQLHGSVRSCRQQVRCCQSVRQRRETTSESVRCVTCAGPFS